MLAAERGIYNGMKGVDLIGQWRMGVRDSLSI